MKSPEQIDPDWNRYAETILVFGGDPEYRVDLRTNLSAADRAEFRRRGLTGSFAVLTAHDPYGQDLSPEENRVLQAKLETDLGNEKIGFIRVDACAADREHCECSVAVGVDQSIALSLAVRYRQMAIFWYDGDAVWLVGAMVSSDPMKLPRSA